jgi:membrane protease YdiL (CAAX protease family)
MTPRAEPSPVALPMREGLITAAIAFAIYYVGGFVVAEVLFVGGKLIYGTYPSRAFGHPVIGIAMLTGAGAAAWFAFTRLHRLGWRAIRFPTLRDAAVYVAAAAVVTALYTLDALALATAHIEDVPPLLRNFAVLDPNPTVTVIGAVTALASGCIAVPFYEEATSRALVFGALIPRCAPFGAAIISALIFSALHFDALGFPLLFAFGLVTTGSYALTRNLLVPIALHATTNVILLGTLVARSLTGH